MTRDEIVQLAWDCGILMRSHQFQNEPTKLERFAALVAAAEREACAKLCDAKAVIEGAVIEGGTAQRCAAAIRARGE